MVQVLNIGYGSTKTSQAEYLVKDTDTVALPRAASPVEPTSVGADDADSTQFGWEFRPVLGRTSVEPGTRQVYVMLALPTDVDSQYQANVESMTYWRKYDSKTKTVGQIITGSWSPWSSEQVPVYQQISYDGGLSPKIRNIAVDDAGDG